MYTVLFESNKSHAKKGKKKRIIPKVVDIEFALLASCRGSTQKPPSLQRKLAGYLNSPAVSLPPMYGSGEHTV